jgi:hypothetical protein
MKTTKITEAQIEDLKISSLPSRPTAPIAFGGKGYTAKDMKEAFDKLPLFIIEKFNMLLDDILSDSDDSIKDAIPTGIKENHSLKNLFSDITDGSFSEYLSVADKSLAQHIEGLSNDIQKIKLALSSLGANDL